MSKHLIRWALIGLILSAQTGLQGCSTASGIGQDISAAGNAVDQHARKLKRY